MTITREHLELAALAAGHKVYAWRMPDEDVMLDDPDAIDIPDIGSDEYLPWRPHTDPGDAAMLADCLLMYVDSRGTAVQARVVDGGWHRVGRDSNPHAWREAVVLCAAAVGERMRGER